MSDRKHMQSTSIAIQALLITIVALFSTNTDAAGAVNLQSWDTTNHIDTGSTTITATGSGLKALLRHSYTNSNKLSKNSALGYQGRWYTFQNHLDLTDVTITVDGDSKFVPGVTVWATDTEEFDGGTFNYEQTSGLWPYTIAPVSFNATGEIGDDGTLWMTFGEGGNVVETLGYAVVGPAGTSKHHPLRPDGVKQSCMVRMMSVIPILLRLVSPEVSIALPIQQRSYSMILPRAGIPSLWAIPVVKIHRCWARAVMN